MLRKILCLGVFLPLLGGCGAPPAPAPTDAPPPGEAAREDDPAASELVQGLDKKERADLYHLSTGSEMIPMAWLKSLDNFKTGRPLLDDVTRYGLIPDPDDPDGLPIGLTTTESRAFPKLGRMVGANCAACHVGEITYKGKSRVVLGAPNLLDFNEFVVAMNESVQAALKPDKLPGFLAKVAKQRESAMTEKTRRLVSALARAMEAEPGELGDFADRLKSSLDEALKGAKEDVEEARAGGGLAALREKVHAKVRADVGKLIGALRPESVKARIKGDVERVKADLEGGYQELVVHAELLKCLLDYHRKLKKIHDQMDPVPGPGRIDAFGAIRDAVMDDDNFIAPTSPVSYPHLWPVSQTIFFHWDGNTNSLMQRNVGQTLGLGAIFNPKTYFSTVLPRNLSKLEHLTWKIRPPAWPDDLFDPVDEAKAERGRTLYKAHCASCHVMPEAYAERVGPPPYPTKDLARYVPLDEVKTDPARVKNYGIAVKTKDGEATFADTLKVVAYKFTQEAFRSNQVGEQDAKDWDRPEAEVRWPIRNGYVARPLAAIWATAPYLHNGSVPTLHDLLRPAAERPRTFYVGYREYDPVKLGYVSEEGKIPADLIAKPPIFRLDATAEGNRNVGHEYGTDLADDQKSDLLEFLKGL